MFLTDLVLRACPVTDQWMVYAPLIWRDFGRGDEIVVPVGTPTDLASTPRYLQQYRLFAKNGKSRRPAVLHDFLYATQTTSKAFADQLFRRALHLEGMHRLHADIYYLGVKWFGFFSWRAHARRLGHL